jgi:hypothetical protein
MPGQLFAHKTETLRETKGRDIRVPPRTDSLAQELNGAGSHAGFGLAVIVDAVDICATVSHKSK